MKVRWFVWPAAAVAALALALPVRAEVPSGDFDQMSFDVKSIVADAKEAVEERQMDDPEGVRLAYRSTRDCVRFSFDPDGETISEPVWLISTEYVEECHWVGDPRNGGHRVCHEVPRWTNRERVQVELREREELFPWEREVFDVCLEGRWLSAYAVRVAHKYTASRNGGYYVLTAGQRVPMEPDKSGIKARPPRTMGQKFVVEFQDRWAKYYKGEQVELHVAFRRDIPNWFDETLIEKDFTFDAAEQYSIDFTKLVGDKLKPGKKYYIKWGFKRLGEISKPTYMKRGETESTPYSPLDKLFVSRF